MERVGFSRVMVPRFRGRDEIIASFKQVRRHLPQAGLPANYMAMMRQAALIKAYDALLVLAGNTGRRQDVTRYRSSLQEARENLSGLLKAFRRKEWWGDILARWTAKGRQRLAQRTEARHVVGASLSKILSDPLHPHQKMIAKWDFEVDNGQLTQAEQFALSFKKTMGYLVWEKPRFR